MIRHLWPLLAGFTLWGLAFTVLYALQYLGCHFGWPPAAHRIVLISCYVIAAALLAALLALQIVRARKRGEATLLGQIGLGATAAALAATAINFAPALLTSACA